MMLQYFDSLRSGLEAKIQKNPDSPNARKVFALEIANLGTRLYSGEDRVAWCGVAAPFDLLAAMGVTSCFVEFTGAMLASTGAVGSFLEEAEHAGLAAETCGYHRSVIGAALKGMMPVPAFMVGTTCPCTGGMAAMENLAKIFERELFVINVPQEVTPHSVQYLADQCRDLTQFVASFTGEPLDEDRLRDAMHKTNRSRELMVEVYDLASRVPSPANGRVLANFGIVMPLFLGTEAGIEVAQAYRDEFSAIAANGGSGVPGERLRLMWLQNRIQFKNPLVDLIEKNYQAVIVSDELNSVTWDPIDIDDPFTGMARRIMSLPLNGPVSRRLEHLADLAGKYRVNGAINPCHWGCRQGTGARGLIQDSLKQIGIPVVNLEVDCVDTRNFSEGQLRTRLEAFLEMLENRPAGASCA